jgi:hypothetical protein
MRSSGVVSTWPAAPCATITGKITRPTAVEAPLVQLYCTYEVVPTGFCTPVPLVHRGWVKQSQPMKTPAAAGFGFRECLLWSLALAAMTSNVCGVSC